ncbi:MAG: AmmeMemoRadiSam system radical SAM enzyme [Candidatus Aenigmarchaeota archaeon]|nr:AmmeMemoRadiSam system radical SAM enzyme [Candidatus Aenigmarchaeota archaeon]
MGKKKLKGLHEAMLWEPQKDKRVLCLLCARRCSIPEGQEGLCRVRVNIGGKLYTKTFGKLTAINIDPIEKKPFYHFYPGAKTLSIATFGCNFKCNFCINWKLSQEWIEETEYYSPEEIVKMANEEGCKVIAYTYNEPTMLFEFAYKTGKLAHRYNIKNVFVTNGYMSLEAVKKISRVLDAAVVDVKASLDPEFYRKYMSVPDVQPIYECIKTFQRQRVFLEITNLIIPQIGDKREFNERLAEWIMNELGSDIPYHLLRFTPDYQLLNLPPTPIETLEEMIDDAKRQGLRYVYIGNVPGHEAENTYCFNCGELLIKRHGFNVLENKLVKGRCPSCGFKINVVTD